MQKHYTDEGLLTLDARRSAEAVRKILDKEIQELNEIAAEGGTALVEAGSHEVTKEAGG